MPKTPLPFGLCLIRVGNICFLSPLVLSKWEDLAFSVCIIFEKSVFIFQFLKGKMHNYVCLTYLCILLFKNWKINTLSSKLRKLNSLGERWSFTKGQLISKCLFGIFNFSKKRTKNSTWLQWYLKSNCFRSFFWKNWRHQKEIPKLFDL